MLFGVKMKQKMKNVKPEFEGMRETFKRGLLGIFLPKGKIVLHLFYYMIIIKT